ncbi:DNA repair protein Rad50 [Aspergillus piperis CBS 112811]|uniref:DNA repair protein RAD50 n=1 Tax=Aspergillus piperis CBS 112811 TaxID=1448313 RepID=A0A8G1REQ2_9EURO|nr:DNA repair protein Rad50 [Aspergillus piperis CBS 112811]RAH61945.1 DNA repair protein Rad50 [Aspergillus piperis CBS 112811]
MPRKESISKPQTIQLSLYQTKIDKLSILGVRSFDNTRSETIQFHTPLTLIVGYNGSGKTTIIECLKYATTGDLPPNSKGGAFIHDPKLCGEKEVLAQVKLSFKGTSGAKMVATRSLQLTVKKTTRQQKTLEGQLLMVKDGERTSISSRVAELDQIMPQYLGVSKAILDSVIFCHQDESLWPMSEPSVLKKKFDEIFEAMKYTKAIDNIKSLRKKQNEELAKYKIMEQHAKEDKEKADRAEKRSIKLQDEIEALREETHQLSQEMRRVAELADKAWKESESYSQVLGALEGKRIEAKTREKDMQQEISHLYENVHQLELANEEIDAYNERGGPHQLERSKRELQSIENEISNLEIEQANITKEINKISAQLKDSENTKRQYADNLTYRQATRSLDAVTEEIEQLAAQNAEVDRSRFKEESERRAREHNALAAKQASKMGEMKGKDDQLMQLLADWNTDYKDAAGKYKEAHIKVETTKAAVDDLARYGGALDKAIMKYHGLKMEEINAIISELWQKTYRGTDVDTILIRSDNENAKGNRSYNYRVCMVKQGAEMDMRGRCSAGQKVLASIIIRLALAECFGVNCGLIALDEPTTNLDRDNIRSLAESLHDIIRTRQQQANFQLIVITHDEEFLRHMQCGDFSDYYYRVSRNEKQKSIIERQSIAEVCLLLLSHPHQPQFFCP